ncbi:MAG TPA: hypothetical protein VGI81_17025 [Tepidisphaeraceae bacterium]|jgi:hypothetical protein
MSDLAALKQRRERPPFQGWKGSVPDEKIAAAVNIINRLIGQVIALGNEPDEDDVRTAVSECVTRFNDLDDGWIMTIEREDIAEAIFAVVDLAGFEADEAWIDDRDW